ncbi:hypothetical protein PtrSN002B_005461 [Pyrenophora tritici-repentis]|uniref:Uncharacterized protein n=1 Tax=Pyrenophora tritici-repentis TaxID=45151 RepID=A0A2W1EN40_9PLEO|nr:hypothetical protein PtrV1_08084 [Pyrenophora tritici-repentis]KAF7449129.1 hypothetical protein A1F99_061780 [Pyrenophora tritici-repentis]KAF7570866.1 hypothetical protein PtrM4_108680 [Pyrenophora tritici-repentis]KAI0589144.1 hypothetical protein Alg215_00537 [Pyrenophora tritici-repentis]KAI0605568.1 hypothetical protein TUN205_10190 [Pyrenophora tritici-repentis]
MYLETRNKSLEELAALYGDAVVVHLTDTTAEQIVEMHRRTKREMTAEHPEYG